MAEFEYVQGKLDAVNKIEYDSTPKNIISRFDVIHGELSEHLDDYAKLSEYDQARRIIGLLTYMAVTGDAPDYAQHQHVIGASSYAESVLLERVDLGFCEYVYRCRFCWRHIRTYTHVGGSTKQEHAVTCVAH